MIKIALTNELQLAFAENLAVCPIQRAFNANVGIHTIQGHFQLDRLHVQLTGNERYRASKFRSEVEGSLLYPAGNFNRGIATNCFTEP